MAVTKHQKFDEVYPYTYYIKHIKSGKKYHGVRWANLKYNRPPKEDFAVYYFTSSPDLSIHFKNNLGEYDYTIKWTFDTVEDAVKYEHTLNKKLIHKEDWINQWSIEATVLSEESKLKISISSKERWENEEYRQMMIRLNKERCDTPEFKKYARDRALSNEKFTFEGRSHTEEAKLKISHKVKEYMLHNHPFKGKGLSEKTKKKMSESAKNKQKSNSHRKNIAKSLTGVKHHRVNCELCGKEVGSRHINRHMKTHKE